MCVCCTIHSIAFVLKENFVWESSETVQTYSFVLTGTTSTWIFGFCRHEIDAQSAMVFITFLPWHDIFLKLIHVLGQLRRRSKAELHAFLAETYAKGVPEPGSCHKLFYNSGLNVNVKYCSRSTPVQRYQYLPNYSFCSFLLLALRVPATVKVPVGQHTAKSPFKFVLFLCGNKEYD